MTASAPNSGEEPAQEGPGRYPQGAAKGRVCQDRHPQGPSQLREEGKPDQHGRNHDGLDAQVAGTLTCSLTVSGEPVTLGT